jgi:hypothetical protein
VLKRSFLIGLRLPQRHLLNDQPLGLIRLPTAVTQDKLTSASGARSFASSAVCDSMGPLAGERAAEAVEAAARVSVVV